MHPARLPLAAFLKQVRYELTGGSGPGGQHRNRTQTFVRVIHEPTGIRSHAGERRSLKLNKENAVQRLRRSLALRHREPIPDLSTLEPSPLWQSRVRGARLVISHKHEDFAALLAEALDGLEWSGGDVARVARLYGISSSQLVKFLGMEPEALRQVNENRKRKGMRMLHP